MKRVRLYETDPFFRHRNLFILAVALFFAIRGLFFPEAVVRNFTSSPLTAHMADYLRHRSLYMLVAIALYIYSYCRDWHFETVVFVLFEVAVCNLAGDFTNIYSRFDLGTVPADLVFFTTLRFGATTCLFVNTFNSHRAPPAPRRFWPGPVPVPRLRSAS